MGEGVCEEREGVEVGRCKEGLLTWWDFAVSDKDEGDCCIKGEEGVTRCPSSCTSECGGGSGDQMGRH